MSEMDLTTTLYIVNIYDQKSYYTSLSSMLLQHSGWNIFSMCIKYYTKIPTLSVLLMMISNGSCPMLSSIDFVDFTVCLRVGVVSTVSPGGHLKNTCELLNLGVLKFSTMYIKRTLQYMGNIFCVEFQRVPSEFHTKYLTHTLKDTIFIQCWNFKSS